MQALNDLHIEDYEIIIVDDGSRDDSGSLADELAAASPRVRVVHHPQNRGYGEALKSGFAAATKDWVMYTDGDGQFNVADLQQFLPYVENYDALLGYRLQRQDHWGRKLNAMLWSLAVRMLIGVKARDIDCGFKVLRRETLAKVLPLQASGAVISAELIAKLQRSGARIQEIGVAHYARHGGQPTGANLRVIARALKELWRLSRRLRSIR